MSEIDFFCGMTPKEIESFMEAQDEMNREKADQYSKDVQVIRDLKKKLPKKLFHFITIALHESENWIKLEIVDKPTGKYQQESKDFGMWVDQYCEFEDSYSGYCYVKLPDGKYLSWKYWM